MLGFRTHISAPVQLVRSKAAEPRQIAAFVEQERRGEKNNGAWEMRQMPGVLVQRPKRYELFLAVLLNGFFGSYSSKA